MIAIVLSFALVDVAAFGTINLVFSETLLARAHRRTVLLGANLLAAAVTIQTRIG